MSAVDNCDSHIAGILQELGAAEQAISWCRDQGLESCSDLQFVAETHLPPCVVTQELWREMQGRPVTMVADIVAVMKTTAPDLRAQNEPMKRKRWQLGTSARKTTPPATTTEDHRRRLDAATAVVDLSWSWAEQGFGLGARVPKFMAARKHAAQVRALSAGKVEAKMLLRATQAWHRLVDWFSKQQVFMPEHGWPAAYVEDYLEEVMHKSGSATALLTF